VNSFFLIIQLCTEFEVEYLSVCHADITKEVLIDVISHIPGTAVSVMLNLRYLDGM